MWSMPKIGGCPDERTLSRAFPLGAEGALARHLGSCPGCQGQWQALERLQNAGRELPIPPLSAEAAERIRAALVSHSVQRIRRPEAWRRPLLVLSAAGLAAAFVLVFRAGRQHPAGQTPSRAVSAAVERRGEVRAVHAAVFQRLRDAPDEAVQLQDGQIEVEVRPLGPGQRFRILTADAEVEVRGTAFEVTAVAGHLSQVLVLHGLVEVRPSGRAAVMLRAGQRWEATASGTPPEAAAHRRRAAGRRAASPGVVERLRAAPAEEPAESAADREFRQGWRALAEGDAEVAAQRFGRAIESGASDGVVEDARFFRGVALARARRPEEARRVLEDYLQRHPRSERAGEAQVLVGGLLLDAGQLDQAAALFRNAVADGVPEVRRSAVAGLAEVIRRANARGPEGR
jgi:TolA-binding protein